jgi:peptidoglycan-associated lipoprotein
MKKEWITMKKPRILHLALFLILATLLAAGCAKKPAAPAMTEPTAPESSITTEQPSREVSGFQEQGVTEAPAGEEMAPQVEAVAGLKRINFDFDQYTLTSAARDILAANAAYMKSHPGVKVLIEGYCDERGSDEYNLALGERRAMAAKNYLVSLGVAADRLSTISYGEEKPLDPGHTEEAWAQNRRDEFKITP